MTPEWYTSAYRIDQLIRRQIGSLTISVEYRQELIAIGSSCLPVERAVATFIVLILYTLFGNHCTMVLQCIRS